MKTDNTHTKAYIEGCKKGNRIAQLKLYNLYYKAMYNTAYRITNDQYEAEDVMQEAFLSAFTKIDTYSGKVTFGAWLKRIVINKSLTALKKNERFETSPLTVAEVSDKSDKQENNIDYSIIKAGEILDKISELKSNYRIALSLHLIEGYDYEEIAQIMNISYENSRTTVSRAKNKLRQLLKK